MKSLADFKRELASHKGYWRFTWQCGSESRSGLRKVVRVQTNSVAMWCQGDRITIRPDGPAIFADPSDDGSENTLVMTYEKVPHDPAL